MTPKPENTATDHVCVWDLIPWYVNGTLSADEHRSVEQSAAQCAACREEIGRQRRLSKVIAGLDVEAHQTEVAWDKLEQQLSRRPRSWWPDLRRFSVPVVPMALAACAGFAVFLVWPTPEDGSFQTLTSEPTDIRTEQATLRIKVGPDADGDAVRRAVADLGLANIGPISSTGLFEATVPETSDVGDVAAQLQDMPGIAFVAGDF